MDPEHPEPPIEPFLDAPPAASADVDLLNAPAAPGEAPPEEVPAFADGAFHQLDPAALTLDRIGWLIFAGILLAGGIIASLVTLFAEGLDNPLPWILLGAGLAAAALAALGGWWLSRRSWDTVRWAASPLGLEIHRGIWWRHMIDVPRSRIQHTDVRQGPLARHFGIGKLIVYTAGTQHASVELDGLPHDRALVLRDFLLRGGNDDDAV